MINQKAFEELKKIQEENRLILKDLYSKSFYHFVKDSFNAVDSNKTFKPHWSVQYLCEHLQLVGTEIEWLLVSLPRGFGKSMFISELFPAWLLLKDPSERIGCFTRTFGVNADEWHRNSFQHYNSDFCKQYFHTSNHEAQFSARIFRTKAGGYRRIGSIESSTVGSDLTGVITDDPTSEEYERSEAIRTYTDNFYRKGLFPAIRRVQRDINYNQLTQEQLREFELTKQLEKEKTNKKMAFMVHTMQRLGVDDPQQKLLDINKSLQDMGIDKKVVFISIPAIAPNTIIYSFPVSKQNYSFQEGEYLEAGTLNKNRINSLKAEMGIEAFETQMQQNPQSNRYSVIKPEYFKWYDDYQGANFNQVFITGDTALKTKESNDYTVYCCWGLTKDAKLYLLDMIRGKWEIPDLTKQLQIFYNDKWKKGINGYHVNPMIYIEDKASGTGVIQELKRQLYPIVGLDRNKGMAGRLYDMTIGVNNVISYIESGVVHLPNHRTSITEPFLKECADFRKDMTHKHDDIVSNLIDAINISISKFNASVHELDLSSSEYW